MIATTAHGQKTTSQSPVSGTFTSIRNKDFTQLIGASTPGISLNYTQDKASLGGSFSIVRDTGTHSDHPMWIQLNPSIGTTTSLYDLSQKAPQPDFSLALSFTFIVRNNYYYDATFQNNYDRIKGADPLKNISTNAGFYYSDALRKDLQSKDPKLSSVDKLYTAKRIDWISINPEWGGTGYSFFDKSKEFSSQEYKIYYQLWGINASFNHYWYLNNEDVKWNGWPTTRFFYYNASIRFGTNNNTDALKKTTINDVSSSIIDPVTNTNRQVIKSSSSYTGQYEKYVAVTPSFEILYSFVKIMAFDFFGSYNLITSNNAGIRNYGSIAGGLYFYTNANSSSVNIGIYYQHSLNSTPVKEQIGLKTKVPIKW
jgi:hypothetical protein